MVQLNRIFIIIATVCSVVFSNSCTVRKVESGPLESRTVQYAPFHSLEVKGSIQVEYTEGPVQPAVIEADEETLERVSMEVKDGHLTIGLKDGNSICIGKSQPVKVTLSSLCLDKIVMSGSGGIKVMSPLHSDSLTIVVAGSGTAEMDSVLCRGSFIASIAGSGTIKAGYIQAATADHDIAGSGEIEVVEKGVLSSSFSIAGSGIVEASLDSCGKVSAEIAGSGVMEFSGRVDRFEQQISGSGCIDIHKLAITSVRQ